MIVLRKCVVLKRVYHPPTIATAKSLAMPGYTTKEPDREALFHGFGVAFEELRDGVGNTSIAIVEYADGTVDTVVPDLIKFTDRETQEPTA